MKTGLTNVRDAVFAVEGKIKFEYAKALNNEDCAEAERLDAVIYHIEQARAELNTALHNLEVNYE